MHIKRKISIEATLKRLGFIEGVNTLKGIFYRKPIGVKDLDGTEYLYEITAYPHEDTYIIVIGDVFVGRTSDANLLTALVRSLEKIVNSPMSLKQD